MNRSTFVQGLCIILLSALTSLCVSSFVRPAQADAADDLVRETARLTAAMERAAGELNQIRRCLEMSDLLNVDLSSTSGGRGIPVTVQNP